MCIYIYPFLSQEVNLKRNKQAKDKCARCTALQAVEPPPSCHQVHKVRRGPDAVENSPDNATCIVVNRP